MAGGFKADMAVKNNYVSECCVLLDPDESYMPTFGSLRLYHLPFDTLSDGIVGVAAAAF
jgi:hypothetical protein